MKRPVQSYLSAATRGLWGAKRREVQAELLGHIEARVQEFQLAGLNSEEALHRTLAELGAPAQVRRGMAYVYCMPVALNSILVSSIAAAALLSLTLLTSGHAQVRVYDPFSPGPPTALYVDRQELLRELQQRGVQARGPALQPAIMFPGRSRAVQVNWEQGGQVLNTQDSRIYVNVGILADEVNKAGLPVRVQGWHNPTLFLNTLPVHLGDETQQVDAFALYSRVLNGVVRDVLERGVAHDLLTTLSADLEAVRWSKTATEAEHRVQVGGRPGTVYALVIVEPSSATFGTRLVPRAVVDIAPVAGDGTVQFHLPQGYTHLQLTGSMERAREALERLSKNHRTLQRHGRRPSPAVALLVELTGSLDKKAETYRTVSINRASLGTIREK